MFTDTISLGILIESSLMRSWRRLKFNCFTNLAKDKKIQRTSSVRQLGDAGDGLAPEQLFAKVDLLSWI